jgi:mannitol/fructose-specific phosphotransferase system IIA component (Ntr-type)
MRLGDLLGEEVVVLDFESKDKWEAIDRLAGLLVERGRLRAEQRRAAVDALVAREKISSTGMDHGVAIPHAQMDGLEEAVAALGISRGGVPFQTPDGKPATLIILLLIPRRSVQKHVRTLAGIARLLNYEEMRQSLVGAKTAKEALRVIREEEAETTA